MIRAKKATVINALANLPECYPHISYDKEAHQLCADFWAARHLLETNPALASEPEFMARLNFLAQAFIGVTLDLTDCIDRPDDYRAFHNGADDDDIQGASIAMLFEWSAPDVWEMHTMSRSTARGGEAFKFADECVRHMFEDEGAAAIWGQTPIANERARKFNRKLGAIPRGFREHYNFGPCELFRTSRREWAEFRASHLNTNTQNSEVI